MQVAGMIQMRAYSGVITTPLMNKSFAKLRFCNAPEQKVF